MTSPSFATAALACTAALAVAAAINAGLALLAGDTLVVPGELGVSTVVLYTIVMLVPATAVLWQLPRFYVPIVLGVAVLTLPFPFIEFGTPIGWWLGVMHLVAGVCAAAIAPRLVTARTRA